MLFEEIEKNAALIAEKQRDIENVTIMKKQEKL